MAELVAKRYAGAIFEVSLELNQVQSVEEELQGIVTILNTYPEFNQLLNSPMIQTQEKKEIMTRLLQGRVSPEVFNFLRILLDKRRFQYIRAITAEYTALVATAQNTAEAVAVTASPMTEEALRQLEAKLTKLSGQTVSLKNEIDQGIIGGVLIKMGNKLIDGTLRNRITQIKDQLAQIIV